jgi:hypothetical protein
MQASLCPSQQGPTQLEVSFVFMILRSEYTRLISINALKTLSMIGDASVSLWIGIEKASLCISCTQSNCMVRYTNILLYQKIEVASILVLLESYCQGKKKRERMKNSIFKDLAVENSTRG